MSKQEDYCEGWGPLYYDKMIKLQFIQQGQQNLVDSQVAEIAALKAEVAQLREVLKMCVDPLREASKADYAGWKECSDTADAIEDTLKQLEEG